MRVIAGVAKGHRLRVPNGRGTRPTSDRVREALFSSLQRHLPAARVADLYAGSGALGIEALSRGAAGATFVERAHGAREALESNLAHTGFEDLAVVVPGRVRSSLREGLPGAPFDLVFLDPPYDVAIDELREVLAGVAEHVVDGGLVALERGRRAPRPPWPARLTQERARRYGDTVVYLARAGRRGDIRGEENVTVSAVCPGSFDPVTNGHLDIIERAASRFDRLIVAVLNNPSKDALFPLDERVSFIEQTAAHLDNVAVETFEGLLVHFCRDRGIRVIVKGLRAVSDFEYELQMAQMNQRLGDVETLFMSASPEWSYLSSSLVKEVARFGGSVEGVVPDPVAKALEHLAEGP